jgi:hypothetical protein
MRTRTKWIVAGGAAAFVLAPIVSVSGSTALDADVQQSGVIVDAEAANRARAARTTTGAAQPQPTGSADPAADPTPKATKKATTKKATTKKATTKKATTKKATTKKATTKKPSADASLEPTGKKTVSAATPVTPNTPVSPVSPVTAE